MNRSSLWRIWERIRDELTFHQDKAPKDALGSVVNPISKRVCIQDTACAAEVFATEYLRTGEGEWLSRAQAALDSVRNADAYAGLNEPRWDPIGWHFNKGSLYMSGTVLDAVWETEDVLGIESGNESRWHSLMNYLESCLHGPGRFAHDAVKPGTRPADVQNTTAIALYLMEYAATKGEFSSHPVLGERERAIDHLAKGQRADGFWPYRYPGWIQQLGFRLRFIQQIPVAHRLVYRRGDSSVFFGDSVHHCYVLYYLTKSALMRDSDVHLELIRKGVDWVFQHLVSASDNGLRFDFEWEPKPRAPRFCNFCDTNLYFLVLATLPLLVQARVITGQSLGKIASGLVTHIENTLLRNGGDFPSVKPHEGKVEILQNILPAIWQGGGWRGSLLSRFIRDRLSEDQRIKGIRE